MGELRQKLEEEGLLEHISRDRMNRLLERADANANEFMTYDEFVHMVKDSV